MPKRVRNPITRHIRNIRRSLTAIDRTLGRLIDLTNGRGRGAAPDRVPKKRTLKLSPKRRAALKLQGQYMGYVRQLKPRQKARVKAVKEKRGFEAAIKVAQRLVT